MKYYIGLLLGRLISEDISNGKWHDMWNFSSPCVTGSVKTISREF
jgi:hypothetical protein